MPGLKGQVREPRADPRARRNSQNLATQPNFVSANEVVALTGEGYFTVTLAAAGGLENSSGELQINLDTNPGLVLAASGIKVLTPGSSGLVLGATGLLIDLDTNPGLVLGAGGTKVLLPASSGLVLGATGLLVDLDTDSLLLLAVGGLSVDEDELYRRHQVWS